MARVKVSPDGGVNPLVRMFGVALRLERLRLNQSSKAMAGRLGLSDTYLRLVESGRALLGQTLVFKLIEVYGELANRPIEFNRLSTFLVAMQWVGAQMADRPEDTNGEEALKGLAERVSDFEVFYERVRAYFVKSGGEQQRFLEEVAAPEVRGFLSSNTYGQSDKSSIEEEILPRSELLKLPTLNIDLLFELKESLQHRTFSHTPNDAAYWESRRASQFRKIRGLFVSHTLVIDAPNLARFHYDYLFSDRFEELQMIFFEDTCDSSALRDDFIRLLNQGRTANGKVALGPKEEAKIKFRCVTKQQQKSLASNLTLIRRRELDSEDATTTRDCYWSFEMFSGLQIGFVGLLLHDRDKVTNLTFEESLTKVGAFDAVWNGLDSTSNS